MAGVVGDTWLQRGSRRTTGDHRNLHLRGVNAKVVQRGAIRTGDRVRKT